MSVGRIPELMLAALILSALLLLVFWTRMTEAEAQQRLLEEIRAAERLGVPVASARALLQEALRPAPRGAGALDAGLARLYPKWVWRWTLLRWRWGRLRAGFGFPLLALALTAGSEAWRRRVEKIRGPLMFPNEILFNLGLWFLLFGGAGLGVLFILSPWTIPLPLWPLLVSGILTIGLMGVIPNLPGKVTHGK